MKQFKWMPVSQLIKTKTKSEPKQRRLFTDDGDNSRASLGMDEDSNMSNISTASDSMDGLTQLTAKPEDKVEWFSLRFVEPKFTSFAAISAGWSEAHDHGVRWGRAIHRGDEHGGEKAGEGGVHLAQQWPIHGGFCWRSEERKWDSLLCQRRQKGKAENFLTWNLLTFHQLISVFYKVGVWKNDKLHGPATYYYSVGR